MTGSSRISGSDLPAAARASSAPRPPVTGWAILWELPLALASWLVYRAIRFGVVLLSALRWWFGSREVFYPWRALSQEHLDRKGKLLELLILGPRWNTASLNAATGPFKVREKIELDCEAMDLDARFWTLMVYALPSRLVWHVNRREIVERSGVLTYTVSRPGYYWINLRYYPQAAWAVFPAVSIDGVAKTAMRAVPLAANECLASLRERTNVFFTALQCHAFFLLKWRHRLPRAWVRHVYLPVGDPRTQFRYGALEPGDRLRIDAAPQVFADGALFCTLYNLASLPLEWLEITTPRVEIVASERSTYLVRIVRMEVVQGDEDTRRHHDGGVIVNIERARCLRSLSARNEPQEDTIMAKEEEVEKSQTPRSQVEANLAVTRKFFEKAITGNIAVLREVVAPDYVSHGSNGADLTGRAQLEKFVGQASAVAPKLLVEPRKNFGSGDQVSRLYFAEAEFSGRLIGIGPRRVRLSYTGQVISIVHNGQIQEDWVVPDYVAIASQLLNEVNQSLYDLLLPWRWSRWSIANDREELNQVLKENLHF